jgi:flagellar protein FliS
LNTTNPVRSYRETQIKTATPAKLILMLYDGAIRQLNQAIEDMDDHHRRYDRISNCLVKAQDIVSELMISLDFERGGEIARNLFALYVFMNRRLLDANIRKDAAPLQEVKRMLAELRAAWAAVAAKTGGGDPQRQFAAQAGGVNIAG